MHRMCENRVHIFLVFSSGFRKKHNRKRCLDLWLVGVIKLFFYLVQLEKEALICAFFPLRKLLWIYLLSQWLR